MSVNSKIKISVVSYTNTLPFRIGIEANPHIQQIALITFDNPADCAQKIKEHKADVGLVPIGALPEMEEYYLVGNYCLGAHGRVDSVKLYGEVPIEKMQQIILDNQSRTSVKLMQILARRHWQTELQYKFGQTGYNTDSVKGKQGALVIGDRNFQMKNQYPYAYDLAEAWYEFTGLPFVFAAWISRVPLSENFEKEFNKACKAGVERIPEIAEKYQNTVPDSVDLSDYLTRRIDYQLDMKKRKAIQLFLDFLKF